MSGNDCNFRRAPRPALTSGRGLADTLKMTTLTEEQRRALRALSRHSKGCEEALLRANGFSIEQLAALASRGFVTMEPTLTDVGDEKRLVVWMQITAAGRKAIGQ